ncbi:helix-turn-helix domain-containing protein [Mesobacillus sp. S13]|uniref:helix-turn-helix domain-containing protein n=1 Tax=Mesobacillus sp. S13 TaxID=2880221 RepID=UPI0039A4F1B7
MIPVYKESIGTRLRLERFKKNMTQTAVCKEIGMKVDTLSRIENNKGKHHKSTIKKLCDYFKIDY